MNIHPMKHLINWLEIPVYDLNRAVRFYETILASSSFYRFEMGDAQYALFPVGDRYNCGALVQGPHYVPSADGVTVYLNGGDDLSCILDRARAENGQVVLEKTYLSEQAGYVGVFIDCEGNKIGLQQA